MRTTSAWTPRSGAHPHRRGDRTEGKHRAAARSSRASRRCVALGRRLVERVGREHESDGDRTRDDVDAQRFDVRAARAVTWLILPVVICLSQRLSHACLSISDLIRWNCEWLIKSVIVYLMVSHHMDNRGNSRANTCVESRLLRKGCIY